MIHGHNTWRSSADRDTRTEAERKIVYKRVYDGDGFMIRWRDVVELTLVEYSWCARRARGQPRTVLAVWSGVGVGLVRQDTDFRVAGKFI